MDHYNRGGIKGHLDAGLLGPIATLELGHGLVNQLGSTRSFARGKAVHDRNRTKPSVTGNGPSARSPLISKSKSGGARAAASSHDDDLSAHIAVIDAAVGEGGAQLALDNRLVKHNKVVKMLEGGDGGRTAGAAAATKTGLADLNTVGVNVHVSGAGKDLIITTAGHGGAAPAALKCLLVHDHGVDELAGEVFIVTACVEGHRWCTAHNGSNKRLGVLIHNKKIVY